MPSSYSTSLRLNLQNTGENSNTWGTLLNSGALSLIDSALAGWTTIALTGNLTLTASNGAADQARSAMLKFTGTGAFTVTVPTVSKSYVVWNALSGALTVTNGSTSVTVQPGEAVQIATDGNANFVRVVPTDFGGAALTGIGSLALTGGGITLAGASAQISGLASPTANNQAATKLYVDNTAFSSAGGTLPGQSGNAGKFISTDGATASWAAAVESVAGLSGAVSATALKSAIAITVADITDFATTQAAIQKFAVCVALLY